MNCCNLPVQAGVVVLLGRGEVGDHVADAPASSRRCRSHIIEVASGQRPE